MHPVRRAEFAAVAVLLLVLDQLTKLWAVATLVPGQPQELVGSVLQLNIIRNPGAAFSTGTGYTWIFTTLSIVATIGVLWFARRVRHRGWAYALGILVAGISGNLIDRLTREPGFYLGHVVDFVQLPNWPIFNVADMCINVAAVLIVILSFKGIGLDGTRISDEDESESEAAGGTK
ncbi:signal peptidase II [Nocardioides albertanoniae]|uniref:Lipoprotein signal peptidase n=1 Tax=Nocardioides albertanoniae TaxID=1175486 RepID=A0A543A9C3_9ACTN|nr:signal peptidase II [Nocardioides albertanoniae]TQL69213.1 signal peptidase II [Nocardioides albertanoniae]